MSNVTHPAHYNSGKIEVIEFIEDQKLGFCRGNAVKYIARAGKKDPSKEIEDLEKSVWYLQREIEQLKAAKEGRAPVRPNDMNPRGYKCSSCFDTGYIRINTPNPLETHTVECRCKKPNDNEICDNCQQRRGGHFGMMECCRPRDASNLFKPSGTYSK